MVSDTITRLDARFARVAPDTLSLPGFLSPAIASSTAFALTSRIRPPPATIGHGDYRSALATRARVAVIDDWYKRNRQICRLRLDSSGASCTQNGSSFRILKESPR